MKIIKVILKVIIKLILLLLVLAVATWLILALTAKATGFTSMASMLYHMGAQLTVIWQRISAN